MAWLQGERVSWLGELHREHLRELGDRITRYVEDLDAARDRAAVAQDELNSRLAEQMNKTMYMLSIVSPGSSFPSACSPASWGSTWAASLAPKTRWPLPSSAPCCSPSP